jgi:hypothetical protein
MFLVPPGASPVDSGLSDPTLPARLMGMKAKTASGDTRTPAQIEAVEIQRDYNESQRRLDAIGAANKWLRTSMSKVCGRFVGERDVALLVFPVLDNPGPGRIWQAVLIPTGSDALRREAEWTGTNWFTALTSAVCDLVDEDVLDVAMRHGLDDWFMFEDIHGEELVP